MGKKRKVQHRAMYVTLQHHVLGGGFTVRYVWTENGEVKRTEESSYAAGRVLSEWPPEARDLLETFIMASEETHAQTLF